MHDRRSATFSPAFSGVESAPPRVAVACLLFAACTGSHSTDRDPDAHDLGPQPDATTLHEDAGELDGGPADGGEGLDSGPSEIRVPAFEGTIVMNDSADMQASGGARVGAISIEDNVGTFVFDDEEVPAVVYVNFYWELAQVQAYTVLGASADRLIVLFPYCSADGHMTEVWYETTDGLPVTRELAAGTCTTTPAVTSSTVRFPDIGLDPPTLLEGFRIEGPRIAFDGTTPGTVDLSGSLFDLFPFNMVDCSMCGEPGAYELHSVLWDADAQTACFAIVYLQVPPADFVWVDLALCLPGLDRPAETLEATYAIP